jgi:hypothetical protein
MARRENRLPVDAAVKKAQFEEGLRDALDELEGN